MSSRTFGYGLSIAFLCVFVFVGDNWLALWYPQAQPAVRLAVLLVLTKAAADILETPVRARRPTVYYEDLARDWLRFGLLSLVAVGLHFVAQRAVSGPVAVAPVALGVYAISYLVRRAS
ncbi:MAG: hypothetical protein Q8P31_01945 [Bacillota bacterium]|nr:hypothetical protein [Bacillota bacterium]